MLSRSGEGRLLRGSGVGAVALALLVCLATSANATGEADATATGTISIVEIRVAGDPIPAPMGLTISAFTVGPDEGPDGPETGTGAVVYGGTAVVTGMAETTQVALTSAVNATASPEGSADGLETVSGSIQFLSEIDGDLEIDIQFDWGLTASATVTDDTLETAEVPFVDVELNESSGGSPGSLCTGGLVVDEQLGAGPAPPDDTPAPLGGSFSTTFILPAGETCAFTALLQTTASAAAEPEPVPTLPGLAAFLLALALLVAAAHRLGQSQPGATR